ncbi:MAG: DNA topoisomerase 4 subunit A [Clostridia bacterium]|nr:DNA topoisomerase 4 subunit A [Clostridia bacterium]
MAKQQQPFEEKILIRNMDDVMHESIMPYAEHIILERALPRVEDGLKPVQRRILYTMMELGLTPDKPHRKSARIVGDCLGKYHPHGDSSVYDAMVHLAQPFNMRVPLVDGHGNFGSMDGDTAAAMRYTEARMTDAALQQLRDIDKDTVHFSLNFDDSTKEPDVLPGRFPNLLINGAMGIAIGLATNIPPHNPSEAIDAVVAVMEDPDISLDELMKIIPAPDFPTGAYLIRSPEIREAYETGRGKLVMRAKTHMEDHKNGKTLIVIDEFPYQINKAYALQKILDVTQEKKALFAGIADIRDESDRSGVRAVIEIKKDYDAKLILQYLFKYTDLQSTFGINMVAIADGRPQQLGLKQIIEFYIAHQREVVTRRTRYELEAAERREHILAGLMVAVNNLDRVIALIRASKSPKEAKEALIREFRLTEIQAQAILDLRLQRLTNLELRLIEKEYAEVVALIGELKAILASDRKLTALIKKELLGIKKQIEDPRRTKLIDDDLNVITREEEVKLVAEDVVVAVCEGMRIRRTAEKQFNIGQVEEEPIAILHTDTSKRIRMFTNLGAVISLPVAEIPETKGSAKSANLASIVQFDNNESIVAVFDDSNEGSYLFSTSQGFVKRSPADEYQLKVKKTTGMNLKKDDTVISVCRDNGKSSILMVTQSGMSIRFETGSVPTTGRVSGGVHGIKAAAGDPVIFSEQVDEEGELLVITDRGYGKRTLLFDYELQGRNGKGVRTFDFKKNGSNGTKIASALYVTVPYEFKVIQRHGAETQFSTEQVRIADKMSKGFLMVAVILDDDVVAVKKV